MAWCIILNGTRLCWLLDSFKCNTHYYFIFCILQICFPTLEGFPTLKGEKERSPEKKKTPSSGHYWLVNLNIKAQRFEIVDSLARNGEALLMDSCHFLIGGIKSIWSKHYPKSKIKIHDWPIELIDSPRQNNT